MGDFLERRDAGKQANNDVECSSNKNHKYKAFIGSREDRAQVKVCVVE
jgi:hypothetical protein